MICQQISNNININNNNNNDKDYFEYVSKLFKISLRGLDLLSEHKIPELPTSIACNEYFCAYGYKEGKYKGLNIMLSPLWDKEIKLIEDPIHSINFKKSLNNEVILMCGIDNENKETCLINLGKDDMSELDMILNPENGRLWKCSFWPEDSNTSNNNSQKPPQNIKIFIDTECEGYQLVQSSSDQILFYRQCNKEKHCNAKFIPKSGSIVNFDMFGNTVVMHHLNNTIFIVHHTTGLPAKQFVDISTMFKTKFRPASFFYKSVSVFSERIVVLLPDGNVVFLCLLVN
jgi:hypothetical protein